MAPGIRTEIPRHFPTRTASATFRMKAAVIFFGGGFDSVTGPREVQAFPDMGLFRHACTRVAIAEIHYDPYWYPRKRCPESRKHESFAIYSPASLRP